MTRPQCSCPAYQSRTRPRLALSLLCLCLAPEILPARNGPMRFRQASWVDGSTERWSMTSVVWPWPSGASRKSAVMLQRERRPATAEATGVRSHTPRPTPSGAVPVCLICCATSRTHASSLGPTEPSKSTKKSLLSTPSFNCTCGHKIKVSSGPNCLSTNARQSQNVTIKVKITVTRATHAGSIRAVTKVLGNTTPKVSAISEINHAASLRSDATSRT
mmetsp:Transcript_114474/g.224589  ORF Transcript_114474/g.224589 Transcript_114474/m.224589 type:complete len:218 (-) Transcript_114474:327-980(-)